MKLLITQKDAKTIAKALCQKFPEKNAEEILYIQKKFTTWVYNKRKTKRNCPKCNMLCRGKLPEFEVSETGIMFDWTSVGFQQ